MQIPIKNIFYLFLYAWKYFEHGNKVSVSGEYANRLENLLASVLIQATDHLLKRGLYRNYVDHNEEVIPLRGRIDFSNSIQTLLLPRGRAICTFDEFSYDVIQNQILKTTLKKLTNINTLDDQYKDNLVGLYNRLDGISTIPIHASMFRRIQLHGNNAYYSFVLKLCELIHLNLLPKKDDGKYRFVDVLQNEQKMGYVFENFIYNFYKLEQKKYRVKSQESINWWAREHDNSIDLPKMNMDVSLRDANRTIIIETKFYKKALQKHPRSEVEKVMSDHLYQLFAYLKNLEANDHNKKNVTRGGDDKNAEGILLYPTVNEDLDLRYEIHGHLIRVATINLNQDWQEIHDDLLSLLGIPTASKQNVA